ncbi:MAG: Fic family protein [Gemmatimonadetes bacterium]|nr:Fic family protein [Gemmatimonadota bacterium]
MAWWRARTAAESYVGLPDTLPSPAAVRVLDQRGLIARPPGDWAFVVRSPAQTDPLRVLRANYWALVATALTRYAPAALDRRTALRLYAGDESIRPQVDVRHAANRSAWHLTVFSGYVLTLRPVDEPSGTGAALPATRLLRVAGVTLPVVAPEHLLLSLTLGDIRDALDLVAIWLRSLIVGMAALDEAYRATPRPVLLRRMAHLAADVGNARLAATMEQVLAAHTRSMLSRANTGVGTSLVLPRYVERSVAGGGREAWLDRYRATFLRAADQLAERLAPLEAGLARADVEVTMAFAREAKLEDTYQSTTIEGYRVTREDVQAVLAGRPHQGRTPDEIERLMALTGYSQAFDWVLGQARLSPGNPSVAAGAEATITEAFILDVFLELWSPSVNAGLVEPSDLRRWRQRAVQITGSDHAPPSSDKLTPLMRLLVEEVRDTRVGPLARAALLHWGVVHVHPFMDGNGRVARLLMNYLLAVSGLAWTTIRAEERRPYFRALEQAHLTLDLAPLADFLGGAVRRATDERAVWMASR